MQDSGLGVIFKVIALIEWVAGLIAAYIAWEKLGIGTGFIVFVSSLISGLMFMGFGEVLCSLRRIENKLSGEASEPENETIVKVQTKERVFEGKDLVYLMISIGFVLLLIVVLVIINKIFP